MAAVREERPQTLIKYVELIERCQTAASNALWYRGVSRADYSLLPTLYRHREPKSAEEFAELEKQIRSRFAQRSIPFVRSTPTDNWAQLFLMQHFGFPTRLLDWSENPFIALFFAASGRDFKATGPTQARTLTFNHDASIWVLDPVAWNKHARSFVSYSGEIASPGDEALKGYSPPLETFDARNTALAMNGAHNSERIVAQRGAFTIFGGNTLPMDKVYDSSGFPEPSLLKIVIEKTLIPAFRKSIFNYGFSESVIFPDLDGLAKETKRLLRFED